MNNEKRKKPLKLKQDSIESNLFDKNLKSLSNGEEALEMSESKQNDENDRLLVDGVKYRFIGLAIGDSPEDIELTNIINSIEEEEREKFKNSKIYHFDL
ncbi:MAG: hypothetical protein SFU98_16395 [Leptospiraceae bacterium]|nr:hypothetical protein [Leptospiraceae bacterium]